MAELDFDDVEKRERANPTLLQRLSGFAFGTPSPRAPDQEGTDEVRKARIASTMRAFLAHREAYVRSLLTSEQMTPETTYALCEAIYAYFRHRQILLSSAELRELAAPVIEQWTSDAKSPPAGPQADERPSVACYADNRGPFQMGGRARSTAREAEEEECVQPSHVTLE